MTGLFNELKRRNVVRVGAAYIIVGWVVVQISQLLFEAFGTPDWVIKTVIVVIGIGFPFALLFAWAFEITPDGIKKTRDVNVTASITTSTGRKLDFVIIAALVAALGYFIVERQSVEPVSIPDSEQVSDQSATDTVDSATEESKPQSIAVLPFVNMSSDKEQEWFADGLTEEILNSLAQTPDLLVAARTSAFGYKGTTASIPVIATELGVEHVLEGSVRRGGETLRITAQLIRASDGFHLWSETFDRTPDDIIAIQEEIAMQIANALETAMDPEALAQMMSAGTSSVPAYEAYLMARGADREARESGDVYVALQALEGYDEAIAIDPEFAHAHFRLSLFWTLQMASNQLLSGITDVPLDEMEARRDEALNNAIRSEGNDSVRTGYEGLKAWNSFEYQRALRLLSRDAANRPNDEEPFMALLLLYSDLAMYDEITAMIRERYEDYELTSSFANVALQALRTPDDAELMRTIAHETIDKFGDDVSMMYQAHRQLLWAGDVDGASRILPQLENSNLPEQNFHLVRLRQICAERRLDEAARMVTTAQEKYGADISIMWLTYEIFGDRESSIAMFTPFDEEGDFRTISDYLSYVHFDPTQYPNFMQFVAGHGVGDRQLIDIPYRCNRS